MSNWFENHQPQWTQISTVAMAPFIQNSNQMASSVDHNRKVFERILSTPAIFKATAKLFGLQDCSDLIIPGFSLRSVDFAVQFCFRCKFSFYEKPIESSLNISLNVCNTFGYRPVCHFFVLTTFWLHLWSITEQTRGNMESICWTEGARNV